MLIGRDENAAYQVRNVCSVNDLVARRTALCADMVPAPVISEVSCFAGHCWSVH